LIIKFISISHLKTKKTMSDNKNIKVGSVNISEDEVQNLMNVMADIPSDNNIVFTPIRKGMEFQITGIKVTKGKNAKEDGTFPLYVNITSSTGANLNPSFFANIDEDEVCIGATKESVAKFVAYHKQQKTTFKVQKYIASSGSTATKDYVPAVCELQVV
jgi:hypothetical protein